MEFTENPILFGEFADYKGRDITEKECIKWWSLRNDNDDGLGDVTKRIIGKEKMFNKRFDKDNKVAHTLCANDVIILYNQCKKHSIKELKCISTFPMDYNFMDNKPEYLCGMSVPPVMMAQVASRIWDYWLSKL